MVAPLSRLLNTTMNPDQFNYLKTRNTGTSNVNGPVTTQLIAAPTDGRRIVIDQLNITFNTATSEIHLLAGTTPILTALYQTSNQSNVNVCLNDVYLRLPVNTAFQMSHRRIVVGTRAWIVEVGYHFESGKV